MIERRFRRQPPLERNADDILRMVLMGEIPIGEKLSEIEISKKLFGMSRTPGRQALNYLVSTGIVEVIPQVGHWIRRVSPEEATEVDRARSLIEAVVIEGIAEPGSYDVTLLIGPLRGMETAKEEESPVDFVLSETIFHRELAGIPRSPAISSAIKALTNVVLVFRAEHPYTVEEMQSQLAFSKTLMESLSANDRVTAEKILNQRAAGL